MIIQVDSREHQYAIKRILSTFDQNGIKYFVSKMNVADYMDIENPYLVIDRKQNLIEICSNVCSDHDRFRNELIRANDLGIHVIILCEHGNGIKSIEDVIWWENPRKRYSPKAINGDMLYKILTTIQRKYGCEFLFCDKKETGRRIIDILSEGKNGSKRD